MGSALPPERNAMFSVHVCILRALLTVNFPHSHVFHGCWLAGAEIISSCVHDFLLLSFWQPNQIMSSKLQWELIQTQGVLLNIDRTAWCSGMSHSPSESKKYYPSLPTSVESSRWCEWKKILNIQRKTCWSVFLCSVYFFPTYTSWEMEFRESNVRNHSLAWYMA